MDFSNLKKELPEIEIYQNHPLAPYTTLKIGGPADIFIHTKSTDEFIKVLKFISKNEVNNFAAHSERVIPALAGRQPEGNEHRQNSFTSLTILGNGSNVLISDSGIRGIVIKNSSSEIEILDTTNNTSDFHQTYTQRKENDPEKYLDFSKINYDESKLPTQIAKVSSGTPLPYAINYLLNHNLTGLQWFAYIPGTVGGAVWQNIHGGSYHFSDYIDSVMTFNFDNQQIETYTKNDLNSQYEKTIFQQKPNLIILSVTLKLFQGDVELGKSVVSNWISQKSKVQPINSAGSVFANPPLSVCQKIWGEQKSTGWIIDQELGLKGFGIGDAQISEKHANLIVNLGHATASDYQAVINKVKTEAKSKLNLTLEPEIKFLGDFSIPTK